MKKHIEITNLNLSIGKKRIITDISFFANKGEKVGIIGESGSGKTMLTSTLTGLNIKEQNIMSGKVSVNGKEVTEWNSDDWSNSLLRGKIISTVFQNPLSSLNPYQKIGKQIKESMKINRPEMSKSEMEEETINLLRSVLIKEPLKVMKKFPHEMSGGMNQRIVICTILAARPKIIIFDEPTTALDSISQIEILNIINNINKKFKTTIIFITHDISFISQLVDRLYIMYGGEMLEYGKTVEVINNPKHPYTWGLLGSIPEIAQDKTTTIQGKMPTDISEIEGDIFAPRSEYALEVDFIKKPSWYKISKTHFVKSWLYDEKAPRIEPPKFIVERWKKWKK